MSAFQRQQALSALMAVAMALFVASNFSPAARWRRPLRVAAVALFALALAAALAEIGFWLFGMRI